MTVQPTKNDPTDRSDEGHLELKPAIISIWLGIKYVDRTFFDEIANEALIRRIREILDEAKDEEGPTSC